MERLTVRFLEGLAESMESLSREADPKGLNPTTALASALILTGAAAFSHALELPLLVLSLSLILTSPARSHRISWAKLQLSILLWTIIVAVPLPFMGAGEPLAQVALGFATLRISVEGLRMMVSFIARVSAATAIFTSITMMVGWRRMIEGLEGLRIPRELVILLNVLIVHIPLFLRRTLGMLSAREARLIAKPKLRDEWGMMATVVGDMILKGYDHAWRLEKGMKARSLDTDRGLPMARAEVGVADMLLLLTTLLILTLKLLPAGL